MTYQVGGTFSPSSITTNAEGYTNFTWTANSPSPSGACGGYTPVSQITFGGVVNNKGNDTATSSWYNGQIVGLSSFETNLLLAPTGETVFANGFNQYGQATFSSDLLDVTTWDPPDPNKNKFQGRQVYETISGESETVTVGGKQVTSTDTCFLDASEAYEAVIPFNQLPNGVTSSWNVGFSGASDGNLYGYDSIGYILSEVGFIRSHTPEILPCTTTLTQAMKVEVDLGVGYPDTQYITHTLSITINKSSIQISKDGVSQTLNQ